VSAPAPTRTAPPAPGPLRRLEAAAIGGIVFRELTIFTRLWRSTTFSALVEPTIYLLAFGFGFGALVSTVAGYDYIEFIGTGVVATAALFSSVFPAMFGTLYKRRYARTYDAVLAAPVDVEELVAGEVGFIAVKAGVYGMAPLLVAGAFGLEPGPGVALVPLIAFLTGLGFAGLGMTFAGVLDSFENFNYVISAVVTPLFLVAGTFFPVSALPGWASVVAQGNPLYHSVELVRHAVFGFEGWADVVHLGVLTAFAAITYSLAVRSLRRRLVD
jgi:lipooligosaccharide transport system permease protein